MLAFCFLLALSPSDDPKSAACLCPRLAATCRAADTACTAAPRGPNYTALMHRRPCSTAYRCWHRWQARGCTVLDSLPAPCERGVCVTWGARGVTP